MHRSGTSAIAGVLNLLGVNLGSNLYPPQPHNPLGLWEHREIIETHEELFGLFGRPWFDYLEPLPESWWQDPKIRPIKEKLSEVVKRDFSNSSIWGIKDPRLCRLLPLWHSIFREVQCNPRCIHIIRNPLEVQTSLKKRNNLSNNVSLLLWLQHILSLNCSSI